MGRNGAGKTTLMSTIAAGGVSGMTSDVKTLHVKPEALGSMVLLSRSRARGIVTSKMVGSTTPEASCKKLSK